MNNGKVILMRQIISDNYMCFSLNSTDVNGITRTTELTFMSFLLTEFFKSPYALSEQISFSEVKFFCNSL